MTTLFVLVGVERSLILSKTWSGNSMTSLDHINATQTILTQKELEDSDQGPMLGEVKQTGNVGIGATSYR